MPLRKDVIDATNQSSTSAQELAADHHLGRPDTIAVRPAEEDHELVSTGREPGASVIVRDHALQVIRNLRPVR